ncbi:MAG: hypothetical protein AAGD07_25010 [Planctomycetota bacterium]
MRWPAIILGLTAIAAAVVLAMLERPLESGCLVLFGFLALVISAYNGRDGVIGDARSDSMWSLDSWGDWDGADMDWFD